MSAILACAFPVFLALALLTVLPVRIPERLADGQRTASTSPNTTPLSNYQRLAHSLPCLLASCGLAYALGVTQRFLFEIAVRDASSFSYRATDSPICPFLPGLFLGPVVSFAIFFRLYRWYYGDRIFDLLDRPGGKDRTTLRGNIRVFPTCMWAMVILSTLVNLIAFDTFLQVTDRELRYSTCFSPITHRHSLGDVEELRIYSRVVAPNGNIVDRNSLEVRLKNGSTIDTFYLIESEHIPEIVALFEKNPLFSGSVTRIDGHK